MLKNNIVAVVFLMFLATNAQNIELPGDLRQHNLTNFSSSLWNPSFSVNSSSRQSVGLWTRWQWQIVDADPTTIFLNYNRKIGDSSSIGIGFIQNNTAVFSNTGGVLNYAHSFNLGTDVVLTLGVNAMGYQQELADTRFRPISQVLLPQSLSKDSFVLQVAPGFNLQINRFSLGVVAENLFDYNYTKRQRHTLPENRVYMGLVSYAIPVSFNFGQDAYLKPSVYYKKLPNQQSQLGITTLLNTNKYWVQAGYNDFYGFSGGLGGNFFKHLSVGVLAEFGNSSALEGIDPSFELLTTYSFGKKKIKVGPSEEDIKKKLAKSEAIAEKKALKQKAKQEKSRERFQKDSLLRLTRQLNSLALREKQMLKKNALKEKEREKFQKDSLLRRTKQANSLALQEKQKLKRYKDSLKTVKKSKKKVPKETAVAETKTLSPEVLAKRKKDSIDRKKLEDALAFSRRLREKMKNDSLWKEKKLANAASSVPAPTKEVVVVQKDEKYEEVTKEGYLEPGYYLIANIFGTKKYLNLFLKDMKKKGLNPAYFYRAKNRFNYVYLGKYTTIKEARAARDSKLNGMYMSKTWIFRVTGE